MELELIRRSLHELCEEDSLDDLRVVLGRLFSDLGIGQYAFVRVDSTVLGASPLLVSNHNGCWQQLYRTHRYQCIDPFLRHARCSSMPFLWLDVSTRASSCRAMRRSRHAPGVMASLLPAAPGSRYTCEASSSRCATSARLSGMVGGRNICLRMRRCCRALPRRCTWVTSTHCRHSSMLLGFSNSRSQCGKCFIVCSDVIVR